MNAQLNAQFISNQQNEVQMIHFKANFPTIALDDDDHILNGLKSIRIQ